MRSTTQLSITLPDEMANFIKAKVDSGAYATTSEVIRAALRALSAQDNALEDFLRMQVARSYDLWQANPSSAIDIDSIRANLYTHHNSTKTK